MPSQGVLAVVACQESIEVARGPVHSRVKPNRKLFRPVPDLKSEAKEQPHNHAVAMEHCQQVVKNDDVVGLPVGKREVDLDLLSKISVNGKTTATQTPLEADADYVAISKYSTSVRVCSHSSWHCACGSRSSAGTSKCAQRRK